MHDPLALLRGGIALPPLSRTKLKLSYITHIKTLLSRSFFWNIFTVQAFDTLHLHISDSALVIGKPQHQLPIHLLPGAPLQETLDRRQHLQFFGLRVQSKLSFSCSFGLRPAVRHTVSSHIVDAQNGSQRVGMVAGGVIHHRQISGAIVDGRKWVHGFGTYKSSNSFKVRSSSFAGFIVNSLSETATI